VLHRGPDIRREVEAVQKLRHPHVLPVHEFGEVDGRQYFTMPLITSGNLDERLKKGAPLPPREAARLVQAVAEGVQHAHEQGVIHRDIKPHNVMLDQTTAGREPRPLLADFGLARMRDSGLSTSGTALGTPSYMPPEQARGQRSAMGPQSDVYGLGATLYALLTVQRYPDRTVDRL
jgi:serine/threonine-protein kinase